MRTEITERQLRSDIEGFLQRLGLGEEFVVTCDGVAVGELVAYRHDEFVPADRIDVAFRTAPSIDAERFRADLATSFEPS